MSLVGPGSDTIPKAKAQSPLSNQRHFRRQCPLQRHRDLSRSQPSSTRQPRDQHARREREFLSSNSKPYKARVKHCLAGNCKTGRSNSRVPSRTKFINSPASPPHLPSEATSLHIACRPVNHKLCRHWPLIDRPVPFSSCVQSRNLLFAGSLT
jgi:hypothetical protein